MSTGPNTVIFGQLMAMVHDQVSLANKARESIISRRENFSFLSNQYDEAMQIARQSGLPLAYRDLSHIADALSQVSILAQPILMCCLRDKRYTEASSGLRDALSTLRLYLERSVEDIEYMTSLCQG